VNRRVPLLLPAALVLLASVGLVAQAPGGGRTPPKPLPLASPRSATFTATEGTWMSLDVSPDGTTIVFDLLGDLYTVPIEGGKATRVTEGLAFDAQPRFSPDGETIVFISDRSGGDNVWTQRLDGTDTTQVTTGNNALYLSPEWMPDGRHVVVSRSGGLGGAAKLQMHAVGRRAPLPLLPPTGNQKAVGAAPTPDGRYIWFAGRDRDWHYNALFPQYQLFRFDREEGTSTLMTSRYGSAFRPAISPDGKWLSYGTRYNAETGLRIRDLATGDERWLAYPIQRDEQESRATLDVLPGYAFTPDSRAVVISYGGTIWRVPVDGTAPSAIPFEAEAKVAIGPEVKFAYSVDTSAMVRAKQIRNPAMSPDGRRMVFTAFDRLWVAGDGGEDPRRLTGAETGEFHPQWSPDGQWIAYATWSDSIGGYLMKARADGTGSPMRLSEVPALYYNVNWSPDGQRVVATRGAARELRAAPDVFFGPTGGEFVWVPSTGGAVTVIAPVGSRDVLHFVASEPDRLYAHSAAEGLVSFRWDGTDVVQHLQVRGASAPGGVMDTPHPDELEALPRRVFPQVVDPYTGAGAPPAEAGGGPPAGLILMSPQGGRAVAQVGRDVYVVDLVRTNGALQTVSVASVAGAPVRVRKLTDVGGEFPSWSSDGHQVHFALGNALFRYDLAEAQALDDSVVALQRATVGRALMARATVDSLRRTRARVDSLTKAGRPVPDSLRVRITALVADSVRQKADSIIAAADEMRARAVRLRALADSTLALGDSTAFDTTAYLPRERRVIVTQRRDVPRGSVVLRGGRVITMKGLEILDGADVVITDNRIVAVGRRDSVTVPDGATIIDVTGKTVLPGFIDTHYHAQWLVPEIHTEQVWQYLTNLAYGVTTTRDPQTNSTDILSYQDRVETGAMLGPRTYSTGPGVFSGEALRDQDHARTVLKRYASYYDTKTLKMYMTGNRQQRQWVITAAKELRLMPTTEGGLDYKLDLTHAMDGYPGVEHNLPIAPIYSDVVKLFKASGTTNSPTLLVSYGGPFGENWYYARENVHDDAKLRRFSPHASVDARSLRRGSGGSGTYSQAGWALDEDQVFPLHARFVRKMLEDSARVGVGSHGQLQGLGYHWEMWAMGSGGASPHDILRAATILGAEAIGLSKDLGSIEAGKLADVLVIDGDPLTDLRQSVNLRYVMKNGRLHDAATLDETWPRQRPLPRQFWQGSDEPAGVAAGMR
jgi:Tol biopolymer transport system component